MTDQRKQVFTTRIIETVIMAVVTGGFVSGMGYLFAMPVVQEQVRSIRGDIGDLKIKIDKIDDRVRSVEINQASRR